MADVNTNVSTDSSSVKQDSNKDPFRIRLDDHDDFNPIAEEKFITSNVFCKSISDIFHQVYADYEGCTFDVNPNQRIFTISLYFNHRDTTGSDLYPACSKEYSDAKAKNDTVRQLRNRDYRLNNGEAYHLTEEGKSGIAEFLCPFDFLFQKNGEVRWNKCVADIADPQAQYVYGAPRSQLTKVGYIDPVKMANLIYGDVEKDTGKHFVYNVRVAGSLPPVVNMGPNAVPSDYMIAIEKISAENTEKLAKECGFSFSSGLNII